jgi:hypothetical protein
LQFAIAQVLAFIAEKLVIQSAIFGQQFAFGTIAKGTSYKCHRLQDILRLWTTHQMAGIPSVVHQIDGKHRGCG